jgi:hypothetical protein
MLFVLGEISIPEFSMEKEWEELINKAKSSINQISNN